MAMHLTSLNDSLITQRVTSISWTSQYFPHFCHCSPSKYLPCCSHRTISWLSRTHTHTHTSTMSAYTMTSSIQTPLMSSTSFQAIISSITALNTLGSYASSQSRKLHPSPPNSKPFHSFLSRLAPVTFHVLNTLP